MGNGNDDEMRATVYTQAMEEIRDRRKIEWQTFAVVNVIYGVALKALWNYKGNIEYFAASVIACFVFFFTWVWFIRIYGNGKRCDHPRIVRCRIQNTLQWYPQVEGHGWRCWWKSWPFWSFGGICLIIGIYCAAFMVILFLGARSAESIADEKKQVQVTTNGVVAGNTSEVVFGKRALDTFSKIKYKKSIACSALVIFLGLFGVIDFFIAKGRYNCTKRMKLFDMVSGVQQHLENGDFSDELREQFIDNTISLPENGTIQAAKWRVCNAVGDIVYVIKKEKNGDLESLNVYLEEDKD